MGGKPGLSGLYRINFEKEEMVTYHKGNSILTSNSVRAISELRGMLLIGTFDGLYTIDLSTNSFWKHTDASLEKGNLSHFSHLFIVCRQESDGMGGDVCRRSEFLQPL